MTAWWDVNHVTQTHDTVWGHAFRNRYLTDALSLSLCVCVYLRSFGCIACRLCCTLHTLQTVEIDVFCSKCGIPWLICEVCSVQHRGRPWLSSTEAIKATHVLPGTLMSSEQIFRNTDRDTCSVTVFFSHSLAWIASGMTSHATNRGGTTCNSSCLCLQ